MRPRGWLEIRYLDALPAALWQVPVAVVAALLDDPDAADAALDVTAPVTSHWARAARLGPADPDLRNAGLECLRLAGAALPRLGAGGAAVAAVENFAERYLEAARCPADDLLDVAAVDGPAGLLAPDALSADIPYPADPQSDRRPRARGSAAGAQARHRRAGGRPVTADLKEIIARELDGSRRRSLTYTDIDDADLVRQHSPLMSPLVWDLAHVANYEELWLLRAVAGIEPTLPDIDDLYDAFKHPRRNRPSLPLLGPAEARSYAARVRGRVLDVLDGVRIPEPAPHADAGPALLDPLPDPLDPLLDGGFVYGMVVQHEHQHDETMLATHQLRVGPPIIDDGAPLPPGRTPARTEVLVPGGECTLGTSTDPWAYDNERPAHRVVLPPFWIDVLPVSNAAHIGFIEAGGYADERLWSPAGWAWRCKEGLAAPQFWRRDGGTLGAYPVRPGRAGAPRRARPARVLVRGGGARPLGGQAAAHRGRMGEGLLLGPGRRAGPPLPVG